MTKKQQKVPSIVVVVVVVAAFVTPGFVIYFAASRNADDDPTSSVSQIQQDEPRQEDQGPVNAGQQSVIADPNTQPEPTTTETQPDPELAITYLEIPEWGIKIPETDKLKNLSYQYVKDNTYTDEETAPYVVALKADHGYELRDDEQCDTFIHVHQWQESQVEHIFGYRTDRYDIPLTNGYMYIPQTNDSCYTGTSYETNLIYDEKIVSGDWYTEDHWRGSELLKMARGIKPL